jgi:hypothetical protein
LLGTTIADDVRFAFIREAAGARSRVLREGDRINGELVTEIRPDRLELTDGATGREVVLQVGDEASPRVHWDGNQADAPVPPAAAQPPGLSPTMQQFVEPSPSEEDQPASSAH